MASIDNNNNNKADWSSIFFLKKLSTAEEETASEKLSTIETIQLSFAFCLLWFLANYTTNASLAYTSVASSTILSSMSGLFTLGIGALFRVEQLNLVKVLAVCLR